MFICKRDPEQSGRGFISKFLAPTLLLLHLLYSLRMLRLSSKAARIGSLSRVSPGKAAAVVVRPAPVALSASSTSRIPTANAQRRAFSSTARTREAAAAAEPVVVPSTSTVPPVKEHAVISAFDLFSIGVGPSRCVNFGTTRLLCTRVNQSWVHFLGFFLSSSHTVGPMRAAKIFVVDLEELGLLEKVETLKITL